MMSRLFKKPAIDTIKFQSRVVKVKKIKTKAKFGSSLSERILRDWIESMFVLLKLICPLFAQTNFKIYLQYKIDIPSIKFSRIVDLKTEITYPNYPEPIETFIEFDGLKFHKLTKQTIKDKKLDSFIQLTNKRLIRISLKTFISERKLSILVLMLLILDPDLTGIKRIYSTAELKRIVKEKPEFKQLTELLSTIVVN